MIPTVNTDQVVSHTARVAGGRRLRWFFPVFSGVLLAVLVVGFAPSFFLRGHITITPPSRLAALAQRLASGDLPLYLIAHGVALTAWYVLVFAQTCLVAAGRTDLHRRLGIAGIGVAILIVPISALVIARGVPRLLPIEAAMRTPVAARQAMSGLIASDVAALVVFCVLVGVALRTRHHRRDIHKRCMIASCFAIYGPALSRFEIFYGLRPPFFTLPAVLLLGLAVYDIATLRRIHGSTFWTAVVAPVVWFCFMETLIFSGAAGAVVDTFR